MNKDIQKQFIEDEFEKIEKKYTYIGDIEEYIFEKGEEIRERIYDKYGFDRDYQDKVEADNAYIYNLIINKLLK